MVVGNVARQAAFDSWMDANGGMSGVDAKDAADYAKVLNDFITVAALVLAVLLLGYLALTLLYPEKF